MQELKILNKDFIFVSGTIGAGKSTIISGLVKKFPNHETKVVKEYIDYKKDGEECLDCFLDGTMVPFEFQKYIVDCFFEQIMDSTADLFICERHPIESLLFASQKVSLEEMEKLFDYIYNLCFKLSIPMPTECEFVNIENSDDREQTVNEIVKRKTHSKAILVHLNVNESTQIKHLIKRNRSSDQKYLMERGMEYLRKINLHYEALPTFRYDIKPETFYVFYRYDSGAPIPLVAVTRRRPNKY